MDIEKIKAMNQYGKDVKQRYDELMKENKLDREELLNKSIVKINKIFDDILDAIEGHAVYPKFKDIEFNLKNINGNRYAMVEYRYDKVLLSLNNSGEATKYNRTAHPEEVYYDKYRVGSNYRYKNAFTDFFLRNKEEIEEVIFNAIKESMDKVVNEQANKIQTEAAYLSRMQEFVG